MAYGRSGGGPHDLHLDGFTTRHMAELVASDTGALAELIAWLGTRQARLHHLLVRPEDGLACHVKLGVERLSGRALIEHLDTADGLRLCSIEHLFVNQDAP